MAGAQQMGIIPTEVITAAQVTASGTKFRPGTASGYDHPTLGYQEFIWMKAAATITAIGSLCVEQTGWIMQMIDTTIVAAGGLGGPGSRCGAAQAALAIGDYGWFQIYGRGSLATSAAAAKGTKLYASATAGAVSTTAGTSTSVEGLTLLTATGGAVTGADAAFSYPHTGLISGATLF